MYGHVESHKMLTDVPLLLYNTFESYDRHLLLKLIFGTYNSMILYTCEPRIYRQKAESYNTAIGKLVFKITIMYMTKHCVLQILR
jgi:hypothetical protein